MLEVVEHLQVPALEALEVPVEQDGVRRSPRLTEAVMANSAMYRRARPSASFR